MPPANASTLMLVLGLFFSVAGCGVPSAISQPGLQSPSPATATPAKVYTKWPFDAKEAARRQEETSRAVGIPTETTLDLGNNVKMKLVLIPAGKFMMGSPGNVVGFSADQGPLHQVALSQPFLMGTYPVTRGEFAAFVRDARYKTDAEEIGWSVACVGTKWGKVKGASWKSPGFVQTNEHPVVCISHNDAAAFCRWLSKKTGRHVTLPSEAQWEYCCRAGTTTAYEWGDDPRDGHGWCNVADQTLKKRDGLDSRLFLDWEDGYAFTSPCGKFKHNSFHLFDMHGNARQWCADWYKQDYYGSSPKVDPQGPDSGEYRVWRGSAWDSSWWQFRSAYRRCDEAAWSCSDLGFRVVAAAQ